MSELIWANFKARPVRTILSVAAVTLQVFFLIFMVGLTRGVVREWGERVVGVGADIMVQQPGASPLLALNNRPSLPESMARQISNIPMVRAVAPTVMVPNSSGISLIYGIDFETFHQIGEGFRFLAGGPFEGDFDVIIDDVKAADRNLAVGDAVELLERQWRVVGIVQRGRGARYFIPMRTAQQLLDVRGMVSVYWVQADAPGNAPVIISAIQEAYPRNEVRKMDEFMSLLVPGNVPLIAPFTTAIIGIGVVITFLVVLLSMYTIVLERTREIGILKALGASRWSIMDLMVREALLVGLIGFALGIASSYGFREVFLATRPTMTVDIIPLWILRGGALALGGCALGAVYPAFRASSLDAVEALGYK